MLYILQMVTLPLKCNEKTNLNCLASFFSAKLNLEYPREPFRMNSSFRRQKPRVVLEMWKSCRGLEIKESCGALSA